MQKLPFLAVLCSLALFIAGCASHDGTITTSTPTGPGVSENGDTATNVQAVPSGLGDHGTSGSPSSASSGLGPPGR